LLRKRIAYLLFPLQEESNAVRAGPARLPKALGRRESHAKKIASGEKRPNLSRDHLLQKFGCPRARRMNHKDLLLVLFEACSVLNVLPDMG